MHVQILDRWNEAICSYLTIVASKFCVGRFLITNYAYTCSNVFTSISQAKSKHCMNVLFICVADVVIDDQDYVVPSIISRQQEGTTICDAVFTKYVVSCTF